MERSRSARLAPAALLAALITTACSSESASSAGSTSSASSGGGGGGGSFTCSDAGVDAADTPPTVQILQPMDGATYTTTDPVPLKGTATDAIDGTITSPLQLFWFKDGVDPTGEGTEDTIDPAKDGAFAPGMHPITFKAVNSRCLEAEQTVQIVVQ